ncbi:MAG: hypothetical protein EHM28_10810 [Spirochaetaceae bacterium]|nr:MAG: hypothetical protein EHM28_10810 [Spirochaetaceae bacterium]
MKRSIIPILNTSNISEKKKIEMKKSSALPVFLNKCLRYTNAAKPPPTTIPEAIELSIIPRDAGEEENQKAADSWNDSGVPVNANTATTVPQTAKNSPKRMAEIKKIAKKEYRDPNAMV